MGRRLPQLYNINMKIYDLSFFFRHGNKDETTKQAFLLDLAQPMTWTFITLGLKMLLRMRLLLRLGPNVITDGTFITLGSNYYTCAFSKPCNKTLCFFNSQNPDPHLSFLLDQSSPIRYSTTLTSILCFTSLNIYQACH